MTIKRGDMFYADLSPVVGSEQGQLGKTKLPTHIAIDSKNVGLKTDSVILAEQVRTIDKSRLKEKIGHIEDKKMMEKIDNALEVSIGLQVAR